MAGSLEHSAPPPPKGPGRGKGLQTELLIDHAYVMRLLQKSLNYGVQRASGLLNSHTEKVMDPHFVETDALPLRTLLDLALHTPSSGYSSVLTNPLLYNKPINISISLNSMSHPSKLSKLRRGSWGSLISCWSVRSMGGHDWHLAPEVGAALWD